MSLDNNGNYPVVARYKLKDGKTMNLRRRDSSDVANAKRASMTSPQKPDVASSQRPSLAPQPSTPSRRLSNSTTRSQGAPYDADVSSVGSRSRAPKLPPRQSSAGASPGGTSRRPSLAPRQSSMSASKSALARSDASSIGSRDKPPKLPPRPPRRPSGLSKAPSNVKNNSPTKGTFTSNQSTSDKLAPSAKNRPTDSKKPSAASNAASKAPALQRSTAAGTSDPQKKPSKKASSLNKSPAPAQDSKPKRPQQAPKKSSQTEKPRPPLKSTPSGRRVSFQDEVERSSKTKDDGSKLPKVSEEGSKQEENSYRKHLPRAKLPESSKPSKRTPTGNGNKDSLARSEPSKNAVSKKPSKKVRNSKDLTEPKEVSQPPMEPDIGANKPRNTAKKDGKLQKGASKLAENDRDLKSILTEGQCGDVTLLIADITKQMRSDIESHFDAQKGLHLIKDDNGSDDILEKDLDFDPGTVDVDAYEKERKLRDQKEKELSRPENKKLKETNLEWFDEWREVVILRVGEAVNSKKVASAQKEKASPKPTNTTRQGQRLQKVDAGTKTSSNMGPKLEDIYPRIQNPLTKLPMKTRSLVLHSILLLLLSLERYNASSRVLLLYLTSSLKIGLNGLQADEEKVAQGLLNAAKQMTADEEASKRLGESENSSRKWKIRLASAAGAAVIGYTGGLAAPMIAAGVGSLMGELGLGATAAAGYLGSVASSATVVGGLFGAYGGRMTGQAMENISAGVHDFAFLPIHGERTEHQGESLDAATTTRRLRVVVAISGWLLEKEEIVTPWKVLKPSAEVFALRFELETLLNLGQSFDTMLQSAVYGYAQSAVIKRTVFAELLGGMTWPMALTKVARVVDNPFNLAKTRADKAGQVLADAIVNRVQGERPVTLIGYSLGARVIFSCLTSLAKRRAFGLVESAVMMGAPITSATTDWRLMRSAVSGRLVNVYSENDYLLAFLYRASSLHYGVAGLVPVTGLAGVENVDVTETVSGHLRYRYLVGSILQKIRFEDIDKDEVAKEAVAFEAILEEEAKRTYYEQAGELYENYKGKKPQYKKKEPKKKDTEVTDADAEKQAAAMEKTVDEKTQSSLMQWAAEQLFLSSPSVDKAKYEKAKKADWKNEAQRKSYYQWAKEATYLSRSGGAEGEKKAKEKQAKAETKLKEATEGQTQDGPKEDEDNQGGAESKDKAQGLPAEKPGYFATAAGYIPSGYVPSIRSAPAEKATEEPDNNLPQEVSADAAAEEAKGYTSYLPSFGGKGSSKGEKKEEIPNETRAENSDDVQVEDAQATPQEAQSNHPSNSEDTVRENDFTTDTEGGAATDGEDPFVDRPSEPQATAGGQSTNDEEEPKSEDTKDKLKHTEQETETQDTTEAASEETPRSKNPKADTEDQNNHE
ncbi:uncharacterized protein KY384_004238 [Bacidia gigantensis]|uniref:uncharacterized protein n=1 Tax=Bacidia gigantensis TaxID=2732470 RepID=UPI001D058325|nr:uncharacterized protein KY384_004238 [Bacidia gigantensis]KAG8530881.1 hypothetical protein KY384_004238 [Bacidia gigantensis]